MFTAQHKKSFVVLNSLLESVEKMEKLKEAIKKIIPQSLGTSRQAKQVQPNNMLRWQILDTFFVVIVKASQVFPSLTA